VNVPKFLVKAMLVIFFGKFESFWPEVPLFEKFCDASGKSKIKVPYWQKSEAI
jgi:hypothetical protein